MKYPINDDRLSLINLNQFSPRYCLLLGATKIEGSMEEMTLILFQNCAVYFEDAKVNCDPGLVLNDDRRSRWIMFSTILRFCHQPRPTHRVEFE